MSEPQRASPRGHLRNKSSVTKSSRPRSSTKGPLDADDDPLSSPASPQLTQLSPTTAQLPRRTASSAHSRSPQVAAAQLTEVKPKDFSFLLRPEIYHPLSALHVPLAFRNSPKQPGPEEPLEQLLAKGHFRAAAIASVAELTGTSAQGPLEPTDSKRIFELLYTRLACLTLIDATPLAAQEVKSLEDLNDARTYVDDATGEHLVPWELRVLNVRLQALGFGDHRRAVMSYHELAREARVQSSDAVSRHDNSASELWKSRLQDLGIRVAGALIDMDDLSGAAHHLSTLRNRSDGKLALSTALLWLHLGDTDSARECAKNCSGDASHSETIILALSNMADADYVAALEKWNTLRDSVEDEMIGVNAAACLLYLGRMQESREMLEGLVESGFASHTLLFNLSTVYELCTEKNRNLKMKLADRVARMDESAAGWEKTNGAFKL